MTVLSKAVWTIGLLVLTVYSWAGITGRLAGTVTDQTGGAISGARITATNSAQGIQTKTLADAKGEYSFPSLPVGTYEILFEAPGFRSEKRTSLAIDANSAVEQSVTLQLAQHAEELTVSDTVPVVHVATASTQLGDAVSSKSITAVALNGRSFTDLLALQPGIAPMTTQQPDSIVMAGASVAIPPSGTLNAGNQSITGQREDANGFMVNGGDVKELMNGGTTIVPTSIPLLNSEFSPTISTPSSAILAVALSTWSPKRGPTSCTAALSNFCATRISMRAISFRPNVVSTGRISSAARSVDPCARTVCSYSAITRERGKVRALTLD